MTAALALVEDQDALTLTDRQRHHEAILSAAISFEFLRVTDTLSLPAMAGYYFTTKENCRAQAVDGAHLLDLLRRHLAWLQTLPTGCPLHLSLISKEAPPWPEAV